MAIAILMRPSEGRVTSPFGMRTHPVTLKPTTPHWGVDFGKDAGTRIIAAASGKVSRVQPDGTFGTYGNTIMLVHEIGGKTYEAVYAHLASIGVKVGQVVGQGAVIGVMGTTGGSTGVHLHFEVHEGRWNNRYTNAKDPMLYIADPDVIQTQALLVKAGYIVAIDGIAGPATSDAIKAFQKAQGLVVDGSAGPLTVAALVAVTTPIIPAPTFIRAGKSFQAGQDFVMANDISDGSNPAEPVTREQVWAMLERFDRYSKAIK